MLKKRAEYSITTSTQFFKRDDCAPLQEDYFFSDCDNENQFLSNITVLPSMVKEFLDQLNICKSCGPDGITARPVERMFKIVVYSPLHPVQ